LYNRSEIDRDTFEKIDEFIMVKENEDYSKGTIEKYNRVLLKFFSECKKNYKLIQYQDIKSWLDKYYSNMKKSTIRNKIIALASFFSYLVRAEYINISPVNKYLWPPKPESIPKGLSIEEMSRLSLQAENISLRDRVIIELFYSTGIRRSELMSLDVCDVNLDYNTVKVKGKGNKERTIKLKPHSDDECIELLNPNVNEFLSHVLMNF